MIGTFCQAHGLGAVSLRYFNVAGASGDVGGPSSGDAPDPERPACRRRPDRARRRVRDRYDTPDGTAIRDYIHIEDLAAAHLLALEGAQAGEHRIFNLGNGNGFSVREVIAAARGVTGAEIPTREAPRRAGDPPMLVASSDRIRAELGWNARKPELERMIGDAWAFIQARPDGYSE